MIFIRPTPAFYIHANQTSPCRRSPTASKNNKTKNNDARTSTSTKRIFVEKTPLHRDENTLNTTLAIDVAGFTLDQINVELEDHILTVLAERTNKLGDTFVARRRFALERDVYDEESIAASLEGGVLELVVTKKPELKARQIKINTGPRIHPLRQPPAQEEEQEVSSSADEVECHKTPNVTTDDSTFSGDDIEYNNDVVSAKTVEENEEDTNDAKTSTSKNPLPSSTTPATSSGSDVTSSNNSPTTTVTSNSNEDTVDTAASADCEDENWEEVIHA